MDGLIITESFSSAFAAGLVDIPVIIGNAQCEPDEDPDNYVQMFSLTEWQFMLNNTFSSSWNNGAAIASSIYNLYKTEAMVNPQKAYDSIVSDYGLYCAQIATAKNALAPVGKRLSKIFLYEEAWQLSHPFIGGNKTLVTYAYHDLFFFVSTSQWDRFGNGSFMPQASDLAQANLLQSIWLDFVYNQSVISSTKGAWKAVNSAPGWPSNYTVYVLQETPAPTTSIINHKANICSYFNSIGIDNANFWWAN